MTAWLQQGWLASAMMLSDRVVARLALTIHSMFPCRAAFEISQVIKVGKNAASS